MTICWMNWDKDLNNIKDIYMNNKRLLTKRIFTK